MAGRNEFTVNLALVTDGVPLLGIVGAPALGLDLARAGRPRRRTADDPSGGSAPPVPIHTRPIPAAGKALDRRRQPLAWRRPHRGFYRCRPGAVRQMAGSAIKFCRVAEGGADIYPRLRATCEWDVAAGHAVVTAAGGKVTDSTGAALRFGAGAKDFIVPEFIAWGDPRATQGGAVNPLPRQRFLQTRPALPRLPGKAGGIGGKGVAAFSAAEQEQPLSHDQPEPGIAGNRDAARDVGRVVTAELRAVDFGMGTKNARFPSLRNRQIAPASEASKPGWPTRGCASVK